MNDIINSNQSISYTSKDFQTIFPELLDLVKTLTSKWDPSISNESDPGVVLLKLNALIADKLNYNIDKNVLECFPLSVTQQSNARQLFEQLGYNMQWYKSAVTNISIKWNGDIKDGYVTIPPFTMVSDADNSVVYTLVGSPEGVADNVFSVNAQNLNYNGDLLTFKAIQGIAIKYDINGDTVIKVNHLDSNNRLYFNTYNVAQNGVFITNTGTNNYLSWEQKNNLVTETLGNNYYTFGLSEDGNTCYLEFPDDAETIIKDGIEITYIKSVGADGNIPINTIEKFYNDLYLTDSVGQNIVLDEDNTRMFNYSSATNGKNPESIDDAYRNFKRISGTFDTLVTLRDYVNYIIRSGLVSNGFVCDKTNDVQCVYQIITLENNVDAIHNLQETVFTPRIVRKRDGTITTEDIAEEALSSFDLKLYLLKYVPSIYTADDFNQTFELLANNEQQSVKYYLEDQKCISHTYKDIEATNAEHSHVCLFKNKYPLNCRITTKYQLTQTQAAEVSQKVRQALFLNLNSTELEFSQSISTAELNDIIVNADERIKSVVIDNIEYDTYAVYWNGSEFKEVNITSSSTDTVTIDINYAASEYDVLEGYAVNDICQYKGERYICTVGINSPAGSFDKNKWSKDSLLVSVDEETFTLKIGYNDYSIYSFVYDSGWTLDDESVDISEYGVTITGTPQDDDILNISVSTATQIRDEIFAKSVLAGVTPLFKNAGEFDYTFNQEYDKITYNIEKIKSNVNITLTNEAPIYNLKSNESIQFFAPNFINGSSYSNYVKFEYNIASDIGMNSDYQLKQNEYIIFYWKTDDDILDVYNYYVYAQGNIIKPSFIIRANMDSTIGASLAAAGNLQNIGTEDNPVLISSSDIEGPMDSLISDNITSLVSKSNILSGSKTITLRKINKIDLDSSYYCYWVLNNSENGNYVLFEDDSEATTQTYLLNNGEYFFYSNSSLTELGILGSGTTITRNSGQGSWVVPATIDLQSILENGTSALTSVWQHPLAGQLTTLVENQYVTVGSGMVLKLERTDNTSTWSVTFSSDADLSEILSNYKIQYKHTSEDSWTDISSIRVGSSSNIGWNARSLLSINTSPSIQQRLLENQTLNLYLEDGTIETITGSDVMLNGINKPYYPKVIKSNYDINYDGGGVYSVLEYLNDGTVGYNSIYSYRENLSTLDRTIRVTNTGDMIFTFTPGVNQLSTTFKLPIGQYMFRISNSSLELTNLQVMMDNVPLGAVYNNSLTNFASVDNGIVYLNIATLASHTLKVVISNHSNNVTIGLLNPFNFDKVDLVSQFYFNKIANKISMLDQNHVFNYLHMIDPDDQIVNPVTANSFLDENHIFNAYTICQLDVLNSNIYILNKK